MALVAGVVALALLWWLVSNYTKSDPKALATTLRKVGGATAFGFAGLLLLRGRIDMAVLVAGGGAWLFGGMPFGLPNPFQRGPARVAKVRSAMIEMDLDAATGALRGRVLAGPLAGTELDTLDRDGLLALLRQCRASDFDGARLLEAYLDRRTPGWRKDAQGDADARPGQAPPGAMTEQEAYEVLGLAPGASAEKVAAAHRALIKRLHPDLGGTTYLAARVNQAKDVLLARHR
jgi:hypothetical protein